MGGKIFRPVQGLWKMRNGLSAEKPSLCGGAPGRYRKYTFMVPFQLQCLQQNIFQKVPPKQGSPDSENL